MPRRDDLRKILILGSGPIVIGQAAEFDYSGVQACKVLLEEGYEVVLVNSNPATIMTDPEFADRTYVEPLLPGPVSQVIARERPDALLPTLGGQTALNLAKTLAEDGTLERHGVELIGADLGAIRRAEDRDLFRETMVQAGLRVPRSDIATTPAEARGAAARLGLPLVVRPAFTLGGRGGGIAHDAGELEAVVARGLKASPISQVLLEESVLGWGEFELEVMRDHNDNVVIVCSIENVDPMGVHTGDSVTVAPQQTLTDRQYQALRDQAIAVIRAVGVETGGSNVQFAVNPATDEIVVIEMNPRVSRSSALASKATGFPIAKIAARLAVGYALEEIPNDITRLTPASFEPAIDYVVVKVPRFAFEKFPDVDDGLTTHMKSVGEAMAIGRTFQQAFGKALRSLELDDAPDLGVPTERLLERLERPRADRYPILLEAFRRGVALDDLATRTGVDPWFLREIGAYATDPGGAFAGERTFKAVDTCAAEFAASTPYYYSGWERPSPAGVRGEVERGGRPSVVILGSGPNRIGQGIEFDYCCVHAAMTVRESGRDAVMVNCNPETVSTDYDTSDRLYFEPLTLEDVLAVVEVERPEGVIVQFGGQTPLKLAASLEAAGVALLGTSVDAIDLAEDRGRFGVMLDRLGYRAPPYATAHSVAEAIMASERVGFPLLARPSYVLGGRAMEIVYGREDLERYLDRTGATYGERVIYLDRFLERAVEVDVDALCDGERVWIGGIMQHVEEAGVHSGDSACVLPPHSLGHEMLELIREQVTGIALELGVVGLLNVQFAVLGDELYVIEANPRASRTVPFVSKATGVPLAKMACRIMLGERVDALGLPVEANGHHVSVKEAVLPFDRFLGSDSLLGPEMRSTGEVMGIARDFPTAFAKAQAAAGAVLPQSGTVFITVTDRDKDAAVGIAAQLQDVGFEIVATRGTARSLSRMGVRCEVLNKVGEGSPHVVDRIESGGVDLVINTPTGSGARSDGYEIRRAAVARGIPCITTVSGGFAAARAIISARADGPPVLALQDVHAGDPEGASAPHPRRSAPLGAGGAARRRTMSSGRSFAATPGDRRRTLAPFGRRALEVVEAREVGAYRLLAAADPDGPSPRPGQFYMLAAAQGWGAGEDERPWLPRAFSFLRARDGRLEFLLEDVGPGTARLAQLVPGDGLWALGPLGVGFAAPRDGRRGVLCGGGIGVVPLAGWEDELDGAAVTLLGFRDRAHARAAELFGVPRVATDDGSAGHHGPVIELLARELGDPHAVVYACGPPPMLEAVRALCAERGVGAQLALEAGMACGFGACFGCAVQTREGYVRLCVDGPVLDAAALDGVAG